MAVITSFKSLKNDWDANEYDQTFSYVSEYGRSLIDLLSPAKGEKVLDVGCGTGDLTNTIAGFGVDIMGVDKSESMVAEANRKYPHISFKVKDATRLDFDSEFDAVFSNATLHWIHDASAVLAGIFHSLKRGGRFVAEFGGKGNIQTIEGELIRQIEKTGYDYRRKAWYFPSIGDYSTLMEKAGFRVTFAQHLDRPTVLKGDDGLKNFISMFCQHFLDDIPENKHREIIENVEQNLHARLYKEGNWMADYKRIRVMGVKE